MESYIIFDLETSGINSKFAEIIEISAIRVKGDNVIQEFNTLVKPANPIEPASTAINGITDAMVADSPEIHEVLPQFIEFIGNDLLLGYNISTFDLPILRRISAEILNIDICNEYLDVLHMARERLAFLPNCKLYTVASYFNICTEGAHRALADCYMTKSCYERLLEIPPCIQATKKKSPTRHKPAFTDETKALQTLQGFLLGIIADDILTESEVMALKKWLDENSYLAGQYPFDRVFAVIEKALEDGILEQCELNEMLALFKKFTSPAEECTCTVESLSLAEKVICLTGDFNYGSRKEIEFLIGQAGGICKGSVSKKTDYVIVGDLGSPDWSCGNYGSKIKKAMELQEKGAGVQIIKEEELIKALTEQGVIS